MPTDPEKLREHRSRAGRKGGYRRAILLTDNQLSEISRKGGIARWGGLTPEERKIERARGRTGAQAIPILTPEQARRRQHENWMRWKQKKEALEKGRAAPGRNKKMAAKG